MGCLDENDAGVLVGMYEGINDGSREGIADGIFVSMGLASLDNATSKPKLSQFSLTVSIVTSSCEFTNT